MAVIEGNFTGTIKGEFTAIGPPPPPVILPTSLTFAVNKNPAEIGTRVIFSGVLSYGNGTKVAGATILFDYSTDGAAWVPEAQLGQFPVTDANGAFSGSILVGGTTAYTSYFRARFAGNATSQPSASPAIALAVTVTPPPPPPPPVATPTQVTMTTSKNPSAIGEIIVVSGRLTDNAGNGISGQVVELQWSWDKVVWSRESQVGLFPPTDAAGNFSSMMKFNGTSAHNEYIRAHFVATGPYLESFGAAITQSITTAPPPPPPPPPPPSTTARLTLTTNPNPSDIGQVVTVSGTLTDAVTGVGLSGRLVHLEYSADGNTWVPDTQIPTFPATNTSGQFSATRTFSFNNGTLAQEYIRVRFDGG